MKLTGRLLCVLLVLLLGLVSLSGQGDPPPADSSGEAEETAADRETAAPMPSRSSSLTLSVLGDSISTFAGLSNGAAADTTNSTIRRFDTFYAQGVYGMYAGDTWWNQAAEVLGMELLVNNSWSGSCIYSPHDPASAGWGDRCVNLHDDTGPDAGREPDIIAVYLGTNDLFSYGTGCGDPEDVDTDALIAGREDGSFDYLTPRNTAEACAIMLHRITHRYPGAQVYCFTIPRLASELKDPEPVNRILRAMAPRYGAVVVDLYEYSGFTGEDASLDLYYADGYVHPGPAGMDAITNCFVAALLENCPRLTFERVSASYSLSGVLLEQGTAPALIRGSAYDTGLAAVNGGELAVTVTMGGEDITDRCWSGGRITIGAVTGDLFIQAGETG